MLFLKINFYFHVVSENAGNSILFPRRYLWLEAKHSFLPAALCERSLTVVSCRLQPITTCFLILLLSPQSIYISGKCVIHCYLLVCVLTVVCGLVVAKLSTEHTKGKEDLWREEWTIWHLHSSGSLLCSFLHNRSLSWRFFEETAEEISVESLARENKD